MVKCFFFTIFVFIHSLCFTEENFCLMNAVTGELIYEMGPNTKKPTTPCSTFKIALSLIGYSEEILKDEEMPVWFFQEGYLDFLESWKTSQTPMSWMRNSCVWYSQVLAQKLGIAKMQHYLAIFEYGNQDLSGGLQSAWLSSSLKISPLEQVEFLSKMVREELSISQLSIKKTKSLLFYEELSDGWKLYGKTGMGTIENLEIGWFVGWVQKESAFLPFAYNICEPKVEPSLRVLRTKELVGEVLFIN
jgi:beta-lactamase class D